MDDIFSMKLEKLKQTLKSKKDRLITSLSNSGVLPLVGGWALRNWVSIIIICSVGFLYVKSEMENVWLTTQLVEEQLRELNIDIEKLKEEQKKNLERIKALETLKEESKKENAKVKEESKKLSSEKKKERLLDYSNRLLKKRGLM